MGVELVVTGAGRSAVWLQGRLRRMLLVMRVRAGSWGIRVVKDREMARRHRTSLGIGGTTDVLTFDLRDGADGPLELDTVVCVDEARRRARELGHGVRAELLLYCVHSLLHVCGYDDVTPEQAAVMHAREDEILQAIGVGMVFTKTTKDERRKTKEGRAREGKR